jgi:hypothetical protein
MAAANTIPKIKRIEVPPNISAVMNAIYSHLGSIR